MSDDLTNQKKDVLARQLTADKCFKTASISSTDSDIVYMNELKKNDSEIVELYDDNESIRSDKQLTSNSTTAGIFDDEEMFDFTKTGAKPKNSSGKKLSKCKKSSLSSSTSSSLSSLSLVSQHSVNSKTKKKSTTQMSNYNFDQMNNPNEDNFDYLNLGDSMFKNIKSTQANESILTGFNQRLTCPLCFKSLKSSLESHIELEHREYECPYCGLLFDNDYILNQHVSTVHTDDLSLKKENCEDSMKLESFGQNLSYEPKSSNTDASMDKLMCPICMLVVKELHMLEIHVESHFGTNSNVNPDSGETNGSGLAFMLDEDRMNRGNSNLSRVASDSSLTANVDENFEIDQVMTLTDDTDDELFLNNDGNQAQNCSMSDYELALMLDKQENESAVFNSNGLDAQLNERLQNEQLKFKLSKEYENNYDMDLKYAIELSESQKADSGMAVDLEHEWLKQKYGMTNTKSSSIAESHLDKAFKTHKIDILTYHHEKNQIEKRVKSIYDDGSTCNKGLIQLIKTNLVNNKAKFYVCTECDHYASGFIDSQYGCGYRNTQMLLSSIREDPRIRDVLFNNNNTLIPSITKIQQLIENAWSLGFDLEGKEQLGGKLYNTAKWIGASDICAMFSSLRIKCELVDIKSAVNSNVGMILINFVKKYFEQELNSGRHIHPIYLQHDGHSRTIVGIESGKTENLLLFDPSTKPNQIESFRQNKPKSMQIFRRNMPVFNKKKVYQLLLIRGVINSDEEYERSKILTSTRIS